MYRGMLCFYSKHRRLLPRRKACGFLDNLLKLIMTQGKKRGLVMHSQRVHSVVYNSPQIATIATSSQIHRGARCLSLSPAVFSLFCLSLSSFLFLSLSLSLSPSLPHTHTHTHSSTAVVHYGVVTRQHLIAIIGRTYRAACLNTC